MARFTSIITLLLIISAVGFGVHWLSTNPGTITIDWLGQELLLQVLDFIVILVVFLIIFWLVLKTLGGLLRLPSKLRQRREKKINKLALKHVADGLGALEIGDKEQSRKSAKILNKLVPDTPIASLIGARAALLQDDKFASREFYKNLLNYKPTEKLAISGLLNISESQGNYGEAIEMAKRGYKIDSSENNAINLLRLYKRAGNFKDARNFIGKYEARRNLLIRGKGKNLELSKEKATLLFMQAKKYHVQGELELSHQTAAKAFRLRPDFVPAAELAIQTALNSERDKLAARMIERSWSHEPFYSLGRKYLTISGHIAAEKQLKKAQKLLSLNKLHPESHRLVAESALDAEDFPLARQHIKQAMRFGISKSICKLMSRVETEDENGDIEVAKQWRIRAEHAAPDAHWHCNACDATHDSWHLICPKCDDMETIFWGPTLDKNMLKAQLKSQAESKHQLASNNEKILQLTSE